MFQKLRDFTQLFLFMGKLAVEKLIQWKVLIMKFSKMVKDQKRK